MKMLQRLSPLFIVFVLCFTATSNCYAEKHKHINLGEGKGLPFSDGVIAGNTLYVAGQEGADEKGKLAAGGIAAEGRPEALLANSDMQRAYFEEEVPTSAPCCPQHFHVLSEHSEYQRLNLRAASFSSTMILPLSGGLRRSSRPMTAITATSVPARSISGNARALTPGIKWPPL